MIKKSTIAFAVLGCFLSFQPFAQSANGPRGELQTIDRHKGNLVRVDPGADWKSYRQFQFAPAVYEPSNPERGLKPSEVLRITETLNASLRSSFGNDPTAQGAILLVKPVITDVKRANALANVLSFLTLQIVVSYGAASVRFELFDASTGLPLGEISGRRSARPWNVYPWNFFDNFEALGHSSLILKSDARTLHKDLNRLTRHGAVRQGALVSGVE